jgi:Ca2+-binding EF-hand superfamily protein
VTFQRANEWDSSAAIDNFYFSYMSLGVRNVEDADIEKMMAEAPGALNFTTFLNMLAEKLHGTDPEDVMIEG